MKGRVVSVKMTNTAVVLVETSKRHPLYNKTYLRSSKYLAHDLLNVAEGDIVEIEKIRPISKRKHWQVVKVLGKDVVALGEAVLEKHAQEAIEEVMPTAKETEESSVVSDQPEKEIKEETKREKVKAKSPVKKAKTTKKGESES
ncbi:30S ribosomal protein S17 [Candidatus Daviesbacteria bacterium RIFCSPHIGHO2_01_FULL_44_29]|uniref:30S ribosomal protein S17 n=1 Tax=Candidatus Daviesbacteria bacterium RIFCSPHIGHO2_02_FULL_43_12 TaxID=1797776 RepID=A0A1F5KG90_9BACT|nr:MAG: 30S ribosomal protein S17 [Candidatus Daviesbacteria bacterium RIFCSPHIGHO2_01_FULL_44_29]OGE39947.1 MAG: 30S ribosomal protein S17 [Candidatus Daviesbacteria bacterium RIFCSPHIGHO2_02_FULL_43_12]OGE40496.1 MAG: 30S ribosomal protein S17 [Candidatus Daviesbacteria bacterium RIFCSPHIGHO2_12_FULL_47_45]OGE70372.1 MAG: 30S ribosomal protein S17 [Candidatus Daviesbacteria bacterium RIFCSPLOWO2_01_FULL_43_15]